MENVGESFLSKCKLALKEQIHSGSRCKLENSQGETEVGNDFEVSPEQCIKRSLSSEIGLETTIQKKQKVVETPDPDVDLELSTPDALEVLRSGSKVVYSCNTCRKSCHALKDFNIHRKKHLPNDKVSFTKFYSCSLCMYVCKKAASLLKHIDKHGERKYGCEACAYTTNRPCVLKIHMLTHSASRPFACTECSFRALQEGYLRHHYLKKHNITIE